LYSVAHYAVGDTKSPLRFAAIRLITATVLGYLGAIVLPPFLRISPHWGAAGLTASAGVAGWIEFLMLRASLNRRVGTKGLEKAYAFMVRVAIPAGLWERPGRLRPEEWELVRLHPYHTGRILARSPVLAPLGVIASRHHERVDGSGYPAGVRGSELDAAACLLAAADVLHALGEPRPHRAASDPPAAARILSGLRWTAAGRCARSQVRRQLAAAAGRPDRTGLDVLRRLVTNRTRRESPPPGDLGLDRAHPHGAHLRQVRGLDPGGPGHVRDAARPDGQRRLAPRRERSTEQSMLRAARPA
jgi:hypothetical protein